MKKCLSALGLAALVLFSPALQAAPAYQEYAVSITSKPPAGVSARADMEAELDKLVNAARKAKGLKPLKPSPLFKVMARAQATDMVIGDFVGHNSTRGEGFGKRFDAFAGEVIYPMRGENAARDRQPGPVDKVKAARLFQQWVKSSSHYRNLLTPDYAYVSTGAVQKGNHLYAIQIFWTEPKAAGTTSCNLPGFC